MKQKKSELDRELESYISRIKKRNTKTAIKDYLNKRRIMKMERERESAKAETIRDYSFEDSSENQLTNGREPFVKALYTKFTNMFKSEGGLQMNEKEAVEIKESGVTDEEFDRELNELEEEELKQEKRAGFFGFISRLNFLKRQNSGYEFPGEEDLERAEEASAQIILEQSEVENDIKRIALVTHSVLQKLPSNKIREFKESDDFLIYKDVLKKYNLIKEQEGGNNE